MKKEHYDHVAIEAKWQKRWQDQKLYEVNPVETKDTYYCLDMFPYPSGEGLHVGHWRGYVLSDFYARHAMLQGKTVLHPMGFDAFGLPAENAAIKRQTNPREFTNKAISHFTEQLRQIGAAYDWSKTLNTSSPEYYQWTQWLFLQLYNHRLAEKRPGLVNWCPNDQTVLANEQVVDGKCERCGTTVTKKELSQWYFKTTSLAQELLQGLDKVEWPEHVKTLQRNWIGRSEGAEITFETRNPTVKRFLLLHGKGGSPDDDFFPWLKQELESQGYEVEVPPLPNSFEPSDQEQAEYVASHCTIDTSTIIVGHSFGGIVAQRLLENGHNIFGLVLVATPYTGDFIDGKQRSTVKEALKKGYDFELVKSRTSFTVALADIHDDIVSPTDLKSYADNLNGRFVEVKANRPHFNGGKEEAILDTCLSSVKVFTTRPDTLFGVTALVLAPDHPLVPHFITSENKREIAQYLSDVRAKTNIDRQTQKESTKTAVFTGSYAKHPMTGTEIPIWVADYVLMEYGTGAVMSVPAHDERDFQFAKTHNLPVKQVIEPEYLQTQEPGIIRPELPFVERDGVITIVKHWSEEKYLCLKWKTVAWGTWITGGIENGQTAEEAAREEILEEVGYKNVRFVRDLGIVHGKFYHVPKQENRLVHGHCLYFELENDEKAAVAEAEQAMHEPLWLEAGEVEKFLTPDSHHWAWKKFNDQEVVHSGDGYLIHSGDFSGRLASDAAADIVKAAGGKPVTTYRLRDWLVSRQRYWGAPIPIVYDPEGKPHPVKDEDLPLLLPEDVGFLPGGESPLARSQEYVDRAEKLYGKGWRFETDTLDTFVDSSWYFYRYLTPQDNGQAFDADLVKKWLPVDLYIGGIEHATLHLLYARFIAYFLAKFNYTAPEITEPFKKLFNIGMITLHGSKMSKSKDNVVSPDTLIEHYGADSLRGYELFVGPMDVEAEWQANGINGIHRFLINLYGLVTGVTDAPSAGESSPLDLAEADFNHYLAAINPMIADFRLNTVISAAMIYVRKLEKSGKIARQETIGKFLITLSPIFPHITEELWERLGNKGSIFKTRWPNVDATLIQTKELSVRLNHKHIGQIEVRGNESEETVRGMINSLDFANRLEGKTWAKVIYKPGLFIDFVE